MTAWIELGREHAAARQAEERHRRTHHGPSPLEAITPYPPGALRLFRFREEATDAELDTWIEKVRTLGITERTTLRDALTMQDQYLFYGYLQRLFLRSLRSRSLDLAALGVEAVGMMDRDRMDWRDLSTATELVAFAVEEAGSDTKPSSTRSRRGPPLRRPSGSGRTRSAIWGRSRT